MHLYLRTLVFFLPFPLCRCKTNLSIELVSSLNLMGVSASTFLLPQRSVPNIMIFVLPFAPFFNQGPDRYSFSSIIFATSFPSHSE